MSMAGSLDNWLRRCLQNPRRILAPYIKDGMTVLDFGCGPGFFTKDMAHLVGPSGRVIASDLQEGMLKILEDKIRGTEIEKRITLRKSEATTIGTPEQVDFVLAFYLVHEVPDQIEFFRQMRSVLKPGGKLLVVEPLFHVSIAAFAKTVDIARSAGFAPVDRPKIFFSKAVVLQNEAEEILTENANQVGITDQSPFFQT